MQHHAMRVVVGPVLLAVILTASPARAQAGGAPAPRVELWAAGGVTSSPVSGTIAASYDPLFTYGVAISGSGGQQLTLESGATLGFEGGLALFPTAHVGLEARVERVAPTLSGTSTPHHAELTYTALYPPSYAPVVVTTRNETAWADPSGTATELTFSFNLVGRWAVGPRALARLSGGLTLARLSASAESLGLIEYRLGGHSVMFSEVKKMAFDLGPVNALGLNAGVGIDVVVSPHLALTLDGRWMRTREATPELVFTGVTNPTEAIWEIDLTTARERFTFDPCTLQVNRLRAVAGLKLLF